MKIAFIVNMFPSLSETFILNQITGLMDLGHKVDVYARNRSDESKVHRDVAGYQVFSHTQYPPEIPRTRILRLLKALLLLMVIAVKYPGRIIKIIRVFNRQRHTTLLRFLQWILPFMPDHYDIIHCHFGPNGIRGADLKQINPRLKIITSFYGYDIRLGQTHGPEIYKTLIELGDMNISIADYCRQNMIAFGFDPGKIVHLPTGIEIKHFRYQQRNFDRLPAPLIILSVGRLVEDKGYQYGIRAVGALLKKLPELSLEYRIVGHGPLETTLKQQVRDLNLQNIVQFLGPMEHQEVIDTLLQAHLFFLPSVAELLPMVLREAQAVGLPIVASDVGGVGQAMVPGVTGFLAPVRDTNALAEKLEYLIQHPKQWSSMGRKGREFVEKNYDMTALSHRLIEIYQSMT